MNQSPKPRIYVACLAAYTSGILHGKWIAAAQDPDLLHAEVQALLKVSPVPRAEEWAIHDYEGFARCHIGEYAPLDDVSRIAFLIEEHGEAFAAYADREGWQNATGESFLDAYRGHWDSELAYAQDLFEEVYAHELPEYLRGYIDYERFAFDLFMDGYYSVQSSEFGVHVFTEN